MALFKKVNHVTLSATFLAPIPALRSCHGSSRTDSWTPAPAASLNSPLANCLKYASPTTVVSYHLSRVHTSRLPRLQGHCLSVCAEFHTWGLLRSEAKKRVKKDPGSGGSEQGSFLAQLSEKKDDPKQLTVATKGEYAEYLRFYV